MQTGDNLDYFKKNHVSSKIFKDYLEKNNWVPQTLWERCWSFIKFCTSGI